MVRTLQLLTNAFPIWVLVMCGFSLWKPELFTWFDKPKIIMGLGLIMLGMGITLTFDDFKKVAKAPRPIFLGVIGQFLIMPFLGWAVAHLFQLPKEFAVGLILVSCCPGGTASNVVTYIARASLPLSLLMTMCSTFAAIFMTPLLTKGLAGQMVPVDGMGLFLSTVKVVLLPVITGLLLNQFAGKAIAPIKPAAPLASVILIGMICASIVGGNRDTIIYQGFSLFLAIATLHILAFAFGFGFAKVFRYEEQICRTVSIEVGMQNSGLGAVLAKEHFAALTAVPCAISAVFHSIIGSVLACYWRIRDEKKDS